MERYTVTMTPDARRWVILDMALFGYCALPDDPDAAHPNLLPLEWKSRAAAEAWLQHCYKAWDSGRVPAPRGWRPAPPERSVWA